MKCFSLTCVLFGICLAFQPWLAAGDVIVDQFTVDSRNVSPTYSSVLLAQGETYSIKVSGTYLFNNFPGLTRRQADAEYNTEDFWSTVQSQQADGNYDLLVVYGESIGTPRFNSTQNLTAQDIDWGIYTSNHIYSHTIVGNGQQIGFVVSDDWMTGNTGLGDNSGSLGVEITHVVPEPSALVLLGMGAMGLLGWAWRRRRI